MNNTDLLLCDNDLAISVTGDIDLAINDIDIAQSAVCNMMISLNELPLEYNRGNALSRRVKLTPSGLAEIETYCRQALMYDTRINIVNAVVATKMSNKQCKIDFIVTTKDGQLVDGSTLLTLEV